jgi:hypothetical protein
MNGADAFRKLSQYPTGYFWEGYLRGLRRNYHGERFGTAEEHSTWCGLKNESLDDTRRYRGIGYDMGFNGIPIAEAIEYAQKEFSESERDRKENYMSEKSEKIIKELKDILSREEGFQSLLVRDILRDVVKRLDDAICGIEIHPAPYLLGFVTDRIVESIIQMSDEDRRKIISFLKCEQDRARSEAKYFFASLSGGRHI